MKQASFFLWYHVGFNIQSDINIYIFYSLILPVQSAFVPHLRQSNKLYVCGLTSTFGHDKPHRVTTADGNSCHRAAMSRRA